MSFKFFAVSDFGYPTAELLSVAKAMHEYAVIHGKPNIIIGLGDNFYPRGVRSSSDRLFKSNWFDVFLKYETLQVPWKMVLGNHDYMGNPNAQIAYHYDTVRNIGNYWHMPSNCYSFSAVVNPTDVSTPPFQINFHALDTNGAQGHVRHSHPQSEQDLRVYIRDLKEKLANQAQDANACRLQWTFVLGHHPIYTQGLEHGKIAECLRENEYYVEQYVPTRAKSAHGGGPVVYTHRKKVQGYNLKQVLLEGGVDGYFSGHEHVFQYHQCCSISESTNTNTRITRSTSTTHCNAHVLHNFICGASGADQRPGTGLWGGPRVSKTSGGVKKDSDRASRSGLPKSVLGQISKSSSGDSGSLENSASDRKCNGEHQLSSSSDTDMDSNSTDAASETSKKDNGLSSTSSSSQEEKCISDNGDLDWVGGANDVGFVAVEVYASAMIVKFIGVKCQTIKEICVNK